MAKHTHSDRLDRWLGKEQVEYISKQFEKFYYPVALNGVPGNVYVMPGGDFTGEIQAGQFMSKHDAAAVTLRKLRARLDLQGRRARAAGVLADIVRAESRAALSVGAFSSIDAVVAAYTGGKGQTLLFNKIGTAAAAVGNAKDLFVSAGTPAAGAAAAAVPGGAAANSATAGSLNFKNLGAANSGHYLQWALSASVVNMGLMLYDRLFAAAVNPNSSAAQAVTGVPTRYTNTAAQSIDYIGGNFAFPANPTTVLAATAHNWVSCAYTSETGAAGTFTTIAGLSACAVGSVDLLVGNWFLPLASGHVGVQKITNVRLSAAVATGTIDMVLAHPIAVNVCPIANLATLDDGLYTSMNLASILDNACLSFLELPKAATTATTYSGYVRTVSE